VSLTLGEWIYALEPVHFHAPSRSAN
jgi:hypothetical protein